MFSGNSPSGDESLWELAQLTALSYELTNLRFSILKAIYYRCIKGEFVLIYVNISLLKASLSNTWNSLAEEYVSVGIV